MEAKIVDEKKNIVAHEGLDAEAMRAFGLIDRMEAKISELSLRAPVECPVTHRHTPGMYIREVFVPAGTVVTSKIHLTEHPYVISQGEVSVWTREEGLVRLCAPHTGITKPFTRRVVYAHTDTRWVTFHCSDTTDVEEIERRIIMKYENPLLQKNEVKELKGEEV